MPGTRHSGGRNKKSASLHLLQGTFKATRHNHDDTVAAPRGTPDPRDLKGEAKAEWDRMVARLEASGTLSTVDDAALRRYAKLHAETESIEASNAELRRLSRKLTDEARRLEGAELVAATAHIVQLEKLRARNLQLLRQGAMAIRQWLVELGQTPAARTRVKPVGGTKQATADAKKARYFDGPTSA